MGVGILERVLALFPNKVTRYELDSALVDGVEFCSKNYAPILPRLREITGRFNTHFHCTIIAYGRDSNYAEGGLGVEGVAGWFGTAGCVGAFGWTGAFGWLGTSGTVGV